MTTETEFFSGWDIGGAHLKVARADKHGQLKVVEQLACPLWQGLDKLRDSLCRALTQLDNVTDQHAITMTGELVDCFTDRHQGVTMLVNCVLEFLAEDKVLFYAGQHGWYRAEQAIQNWQHVASMNWLASASLVASYYRDALFIDIGSTTCDIIPIHNHSPIPQAHDDHQRQQSRELTYTGAIRTPLIALAQQVPFNGATVTLAAEWFATTADCWCLLGYLDSEQIQDNSADGQSWQKNHCQQRLARMLGTDADNASTEQWLNCARWFAEQQLQLITESCLFAMSANHNLTESAPIIGAGVGRFIAKLVSVRIQRQYIDFTDLNGINMPAAADHAPAAALALLAQQQFT